MVVMNQFTNIVAVNHCDVSIEFSFNFPLMKETPVDYPHPLDSIWTFSCFARFDILPGKD